MWKILEAIQQTNGQKHVQKDLIHEDDAEAISFETESFTKTTNSNVNALCLRAHSDTNETDEHEHDNEEIDGREDSDSDLFDSQDKDSEGKMGRNSDNYLSTTNIIKY